MVNSQTITLGEDADSSKTEVNNRVKEAIAKYEKAGKRLVDEALWITFKDDFDDFTRATLDIVEWINKRHLRRVLREHGVWVESDPGKNTIENALWKTLDEDEPADWPITEIFQLIKRGKTNDFVSPMVTTLMVQAKEGFYQEEFDTFQDPPSNEQILKTPAIVSKNLAVDDGTPRSTNRTKSPTSYRFQSSDPRIVLPTAENATKPRSSSPPETQFKTYPDSQPNLHSREIINLKKIYQDNMKFGQSGDNFNQKLKIFRDECQQTGIPKEIYHKAISTMLKGLALDYYHNVLLGQNLSFDQLCHYIQTYFEDDNYRQHTTTKWDVQTLKRVMEKHPEKTTSDCFDILVHNLRSIYNMLPPALQTEEFMLNKLINTCSTVPECQVASIQQINKLPVFINTMRNAIIMYERCHGPRPPENHIQTSTETFMTDRRYYGPQNYSPPQLRNRLTGAGKKDKRCWVCNKEHCWSTNHSKDDQIAAKNRFRQVFRSKLGNKYPPKRFESFLTHFLAENDGENDQWDERIKEAEESFNNIAIDDSDEETFDLIEADAFFTSFGKLPADEAYKLFDNMSTKALEHRLFPAAIDEFYQPEQDAAILPKLRYDNAIFHGICIDTGAAKISSAGLGQYQAYNALYPTPLVQREQVSIQFGKGPAAKPLGTARIHTPIGKVDFHVIDSNTPFLLCLQDMDKLGVHYNNLTDTLYSPMGNISVIRRFGHPFIFWGNSPANQNNAIECFLTETELRRLHRRFGHPAVHRLQRVLERAGHEVDNGILNYLTKVCSHCQKHGKSPGRFRFTLKDDVNFNYCILVDIMYIDGRPIIHIVDEATRYQAGRWLKDISTSHVWEKIQECWINTYLGPPDIITHDPGRTFISKEFKQNAILQGIMTKETPVEAHNSVGLVERYHAPIRRAYQIISAELPTMNKDSALQMAFKAVNDTAGPDGLVPTLLVYGAYPRMTTYDAPSATIAQRSAALKKAMSEVRKLRAQRQVNDALNMRNGPITTAVRDLPIGAPVWVWREQPGDQLGKWTGPHSLLENNGTSCIVQLNAPTKFSATVIKPYYQDDTNSTEQQIVPESETLDPQNTHESDSEQIAVISDQQANQETPPQQPIRRGRGRPRKNPLPEPHLSPSTSLLAEVFTAGEYQTLISQDSETRGQYEMSRLKEINGLFERGVFKLIHAKDLPPETKIFNSRFVDEIKNKGTDLAYEKSRLIVQAWNDKGKTTVLTESPTIQRSSQRIILAISPIFRDFHIYLRDITQAYTQSKTRLVRPFYIRPPTEMNIPEEHCLKVVLPLYGIPESGNHWFNTYSSHHIDNLKMKPSAHDPCLMITNKEDLFGLVGLQTDDTLILASTEFADLEESELKRARFTAKARTKLTADHPLKFNGGIITLQTDGSIQLSQENHAKKLNTVKSNPIDLVSSRGIVQPKVSMQKQYIAQRARGAYMATMCQPEATFDLSFAAQISMPTENDAKMLNKRLQWQIDNPERGLRFVRLDKDSLKLIVFTDSSFANNKDYSSQLGYIIVLADSENKANIIHWSSTKCRRITRSVLASELFAMSTGYDTAASLKTTLDAIFGKQIPLVVCTDSKSLFECLVKLGTTREKRLMVDLMSLRQSYERRAITEVKWITGDSNPADALTKSKACPALRDLVDANRIQLDEIEWVERDSGVTTEDKDK